MASTTPENFKPQVTIRRKAALGIAGLDDDEASRPSSYPILVLSALTTLVPAAVLANVISVDSFGSRNANEKGFAVGSSYLLQAIPGILRETSTSLLLLTVLSTMHVLAAETCLRFVARHTSKVVWFKWPLCLLCGLNGRSVFSLLSVPFPCHWRVACSRSTPYR